MPAPITVREPAELLPFLFAHWPGTKKTRVRIWLKYEAVRVNGRVVTQFNHPLRPGDVVSIREQRPVMPEQTALFSMKIHFEDDWVIVIAKPANLLTIASIAEPENNAYFQLTAYVKAQDPGSRERIWIVHRLDRETSGLMVFARTFAAKRTLQDHWERAEKRYLAVVEGTLKADHGVFESHLDETNPFRVYSRPRSAQTRQAITHFRVLKRGRGRSLVELTLKSGRRHQIRVQLADAGCPIIGDAKYRAATNPAGRLGLHACFLRFPHPETRKDLTFESPLPQELAKLV